MKGNGNIEMIKLVRILDKAIEEIDILEEYYKEQSNTTRQHIEVEMDKYKYGLAIYKYLCGRIHNEEKPRCMNEFEEKFIAEELIVMEDNNENEDVQYKLRHPKKYMDKYELNPFVSKKKSISLIKQAMTLNDSVIIMLLIRFESIISEIYKMLLTTFPDAYLKDRSITYSELICLNSDIKEIKKSFINDEVDEFMRKPLKDWYSTFEKKHKCHFNFGDDFEQFKEIYYRRNVVVHNQGIANSSYLNGVSGKYTCKMGTRLTPTREYLLEAIDCTRIMIIETILGLTKICSDKSNVIKRLFNIGFKYMIESKWKVSKYIFNVLMHLDEQNEVSLWCNKVNYYISCKNLEGIDSIRKEVEKMDTSIMAPKLAIAKPALLDDFAEVTRILNTLIGNDIEVNSIKSWPMFIQYRNSSDYDKLIEKHKDLFELETYSASDIKCLSNPKEDINKKTNQLLNS